jgi:hypothetical protein
MPFQSGKKKNASGDLKHQDRESKDPATASPATSDETKSKSSTSTRKRPGNRSKPKDWAEEMERQVHHDETKRLPGHQKMPKPPNVIAPQPGKFPIVFDVTTGKPTNDCHFSINVGQIVRNHCVIYEQLTSSIDYNRYVAELSDGRSQEHVSQFEGDFLSAAVLTTAQNLVHSVQEHGRPVIGLSQVVKAEIPHITPVRDVSAQYGLVPDANTGQMFVPREVSSATRKIIRAAWQLHCSTATTVKARSTYAATRAWAPISGRDEDFRFTCRALLQKWLDREGYDFLIVSRVLPLFSGTYPSWYEAIAEDLRPNIQWMFAAIENAQDPGPWVTRLNTIPIAFYADLGVGRPINNQGHYSDWNILDLAFDFDYKEHFAEIVDAWAAKAPVLARLFHTAGISHCTKDGTLAQFSHIVNDDGVVEFRNQTTNGKAEASLAVCFPPSAWFVDTRTPHLAAAIGEVQLPEIVMKWVQKCIK